MLFQSDPSRIPVIFLCIDAVEMEWFRRKRTEGRSLLKEVLNTYGSIRFRSIPVASLVLRLTNRGTATPLVAGFSEDQPTTSIA